MPKYNINVEISDGNAFAIMGAVASALRKHGVPEIEVSEYRKESISGDYDHLLITAMEWVNLDLPGQDLDEEIYSDDGNILETLDDEEDDSDGGIEEYRAYGGGRW